MEENLLEIDRIVEDLGLPISAFDNLALKICDYYQKDEKLVI